MTGSGSVTLVCDTAATIRGATVGAVACRLAIRGNRRLSVRRLHVVNSPTVQIDGTRFDGALAGADQAGIIADGNTRLFLSACEAVGLKSAVSAKNGAAVRITGAQAAQWPHRVTDAGQVTFAP